MANGKTSGHGPVTGKKYFIHEGSRSVRVDDSFTRPVPIDQGWEQVTLEAWIAFRKETANMSPVKKNKLHRSLYPCSTSSKP